MFRGAEGQLPMRGGDGPSEVAGQPSLAARFVGQGRGTINRYGLDLELPPERRARGVVWSLVVGAVGGRLPLAILPDRSSLRTRPGARPLAPPGTSHLRVWGHSCSKVQARFSDS